MIRLLEQAIATIRDLPEAEQDIAAEFLLGFANPDAQRHQLTEEQVAEVELTKQEVRAGKIATDAEMQDLWRRFSR